MQSNRNDKRIAKNTIYLYMRMFVSMLLSVYTSRIVLEALGETDFGIYNVVGGIVVLFNFLNATLVASTQRYINMALGEQSERYVKNVFSAAIKIHFVLSIIIALLSETIGLYLLNTALTIPEGRMFAANVIYQLSILTLIFSINTSPLQAMVISQEKMGSYAILSIVETVMKFGSAYYLLVTLSDRLIVYGVTLCLIGMVVFTSYWIVCRFKFPICRGRIVVEDKTIYKSMLTFSSWALIGSLAGSLSNQGINIILNMFFGPVVNAARGLAMTFNNYVYSFVNNFTVAATPQIIKTYASKEYDTMYDLLLKSIKFSLFLYAFLAIPVIFECHFVLDIWLKEVPRHTVVFCQIILIQSFISCAERPMATACNAIGCVKQVNLSVGILFMSTFLLSWGLLYCFENVLIPFIVYLIADGIGVVCFLYFIGKYLGVKRFLFFRDVVARAIVTFVPSAIVVYFIHFQINEGWIRLIVTCCVSTMTLALSIYTIGMEKSERYKAKTLTNKIFHKHDRVIKTD